jgi:iron(III) transport system permease protein
MTDLGTPLMFEYRRVISVGIFHARSTPGSPDSNTLVVIMLVMVAVLYYAAKLIVGRRGHEMMARSVQVTRGRPLGRWQTVGAWLLFGTVILLAVLPHIMIVLISVSGHWQDTLVPASLTLSHHRAAAAHELTLSSVRNSLLYAAIATAVCVLLSVWAAYVLVRKRFFGRNLLDAMTMLPLAVPGLVLAFGFLTCYRGAGQALVDWGLWSVNLLNPEKNPVLLLVIAYAVRRVPYMVRSAVAGFEQTSRTLEEAAMNVGASPLRSVLRITVPLVMANLIAGGILVFTFSMLEVSDSLLLAKEPQYFPITAAIYKVFSDSYLTAREGIASALGVWAMALLATALVVSTRLLGRKLGAIFRA